MCYNMVVLLCVCVCVYVTVYLYAKCANEAGVSLSVRYLDSLQPGDGALHHL